MIHSLHFGRAFWLDEEHNLCSCPWLKDGTLMEDQTDYVSEWTDLEGINLDKLLYIHRHLIVSDAVNYYGDQK
jgi:hypothetical protein|tara:strand:- start:195 stop:413 length:219 start_codon:yes stop_codon:yes gene_type:complete